jgi:hypothetical protein
MPCLPEGKLPTSGDGNLCVGSKGMLLAGYENYVQRPEKDFADYKRPPKTIPASGGSVAVSGVCARRCGLVPCRVAAPYLISREWYAVPTQPTITAERELATSQRGRCSHWRESPPW